MEDRVVVVPVSGSGYMRPRHFGVALQRQRIHRIRRPGFVLGGLEQTSRGLVRKAAPPAGLSFLCPLLVLRILDREGLQSWRLHFGHCIDVRGSLEPCPEVF